MGFMVGNFSDCVTMPSFCSSGLFTMALTGRGAGVGDFVTKLEMQQVLRLRM